MRFSKSFISYEKKGIANSEERAKYRRIVKHITEAVVRSVHVSDVLMGCLDEDLRGCEVNITFTDDESIRAINKEHREIDKSTDVLSFPINDFLNGDGEILMSNLNERFNRLLLGDIVISIPTMRRQAEEYGHGVERECAFLLCHGLLHLFGYDHMNKNDEKLMFECTEEILEEAGYARR